MGTVKRVGIADCYGIAIYGEENETNLNAYCIRASCNPNKRAVAFELEINPTHDNTVRTLINQGRTEEALKFLKNVAINVRACGANSMSDVYWRQIPNPKLDPLYVKL
jgi:hypothetical protein